MPSLAVAAERRPATALALARGSWTAEMGYLYLQLLYKVKQLEKHARSNELSGPARLAARSSAAHRA